MLLAKALSCQGREGGDTGHGQRAIGQPSKKPGHVESKAGVTGVKRAKPGAARANRWRKPSPGKTFSGGLLVLWSTCRATHLQLFPRGDTHL
jgi:hypothetical protein